jgi:catechol 2,3-dioxygenase-like lactoylglutathione lyase family enzyme
MIRALDHLAIAVEDFAGAVDSYRRLLGREPELNPGGGADRAWFQLANMALEVIAPSGDGPAGDRLRARLEEAGEGLWICAFQVDDLAEATRIAARRGLDITPVSDTVTLMRVAGLNLLMTPGRIGAEPSPFTAPESACVAGLDHVAVRTPHPDRAVAIYRDKLGLDLRLDRSTDALNARLLYFRLGGMVLEFSARLNTRPTDGPDAFQGIAWQVADAAAAHARLIAAGFEVSDLRPGLKPGTDAFTVRNAPAGVPTLIMCSDAEA